MNQRPPRLCYGGASPDTGNLGVSALCYAVVGGLAKCDPEIDLTVFDEGSGLRRETAEFAGGRFNFTLCGATQTRRVWQRRSFWNIRVSNWLGGMGNPAVKCLRNADAVLDISGGDSFTDLYGPKRFHSVTFSKRLVLEHRRPLILLPQTYGPYRDPRSRAIAADIVRRAAMAWARDARSFDVLKDLIGQDFDPQRHLSGVDVAFALETRPPRQPLPDPIATWLACGTGFQPVNAASCGTGFQPVSSGPPPGRPGQATPTYVGSTEPQACPAAPLAPVPLDPSVPSVIGFNVSGLIWHDPVAMRDRYGFKADYRECVLGFLRRILQESDARILLIPHVLLPPGHYESDPGANDAVIAALRSDPDERVQEAADRRVALVPPVYDPMEMKWIIARTDWFCGTRMHATIAGLSSGVPTAAIAYSVKTAGVFETCGQGKHVADPRKEQTPEIVGQLWNSFNEKDNSRLSLTSSAHANVQKAEQQMATIVAHTQPGVAPLPAQEVPA